MWSLPTAVVSLDSFEQKLQPLVKAVKSTRDTNQFPRWIVATVEKSYQWADEVKALVSALDSIQLTTAASHITIADVAFIDADPQQLINRPHETLLRAILSSPLLPVSSAGVSLLKTCYRESCQRLGPVQTRAIFISEQERITHEKREAGLLLLQWSDVVAGQTDHEECSGVNERVRIDEVYLASQLILACCQRSMIDGKVNQEVVSKIQRTIVADESKGTLRMLCIGLSLSPAAVYCCAESSENETESASTDRITIDLIGKVLQHQSLWQILYDCARMDIAQFQCLDDVFAVFELLCEKNPTLHCIAKQSMAAHNDTLQHQHTSGSSS